MTRRVALREELKELFGEDGATNDGIARFASLATLAPSVSPPRFLRAQILEAAVRPRYAYLHRAAAVLDLAVEQVRALLDSIDDPSGWMSTPGEGIFIRDIVGGPAVANAVVGFIRVPAGGHFPHHRHEGREDVLVLQGGIRDASGTIYRAGDLATMDAGSGHDFDALPGDELLFLAIVRVALDFSSWGGPRIPA